MQKYIAMAWPKSSSLMTERANRIQDQIFFTGDKWARVHDEHGLRVFALNFNPPAWRCLTHPKLNGVIIGTLFRNANDPTEPVEHLTDSEAGEISRSGGRSLTQSYWGRYVALIRDAENRDLIALRDPSGMLPAYYTVQDELVTIFSAGLDIANIVCDRLTLNWSNVAKRLCHSLYQGSDTAFTQLRSLQPGQRLTFGGRALRADWIWDPRTFVARSRARARTGLSINQAATELRRATESSVASWAASYNRISIHLSGGLDSSIVLGCVAPRSKQSGSVFATHFYSVNEDSDERVFARQMAEHCSVPLTEYEVRSQQFDLSPRDRRPAIDPVADRGSDTLLHDIQHAQEYSVSAVFGGRGGDNVFFSQKSLLLASDYIFDQGLKRDSLPVISSAAKLTGASVWHVVGSIFRSNVLGQRLGLSGAAEKYPHFLASSFAAASHSREVQHDWENNLEEFAPGKHIHIVNLLKTHIYPVSTDYLDFVYPLVSQPVVETCLSTPTYVLSNGGISRHLARQAFSDRMPETIAYRQNKASGGRFFTAALLSKIPEIRSFLLDGELSAAGVLDRNLVDQGVRESTVMTNQYYLRPIVFAVMMEAWLRDVKSATQQ